MIKFITAGLVIILRLYQYSYARWIHCIYKTLQNIRVLQKRVYSKGIRHKIKIRNAHVKHKYKIVVVKLLSSVRPFVTPWTAAHQASLSFTNSRSLGKLMSIELMMPSNRLILCHPHFSSCPQFFPESGSFPMSWLFTSEGQRIDWFELLAIQGTLKSLLQHHISKASILCCSAFFVVQLSRLYITTGKTIALAL